MAGSSSWQRIVLLGIVSLFALFVFLSPSGVWNDWRGNKDAARDWDDDTSKAGKAVEGSSSGDGQAATLAPTTTVAPAVVLVKLLDYPSETFTYRVDASMCKAPVRIGNGGDGGWNICTDTFPDKKRPCLIYSYGIRDDFTFDDGMDKRFECSIHGFDPSVPEMAGPYQSGTQRRFFHLEGVGKVGVYPPGTAPFRWPGLDYLKGASNTKTWTLGSVDGHMKKLGHEYIKILKIDVEGAEWDTLTDMITSGLMGSGRIEQIVMEIHFDEAFYATGSSSPDTVTMTRRGPIPANDPINYFSILHTMVEYGYVLWRWQWNVGSHCCIELSFMHKSSRQ